ncbi:glycosyl hydrolase [Massilioclostridium coli]|uniref:glycosyl hydrolase n=1 Tax=Massilioclostridium coli TaxID=1870991 RepID=UPI0022E0924F|nr:glycosyl hydrolase [Massilioclostridium coli]
MKIKKFGRCLSALLATTMIISAMSSTNVFQVSASQKSTSLADEFQSPPVESKVTTRYWLPQAAVEEEELRQDVREFADLGLGGFEVVGFTTLTTGVTEEYQWGTENWDKAMEILVDEAKKQGLQVHVTNGPGWPISVPSVTDPDDEASCYEMTYGTATLSSGQIYQGTVPARNTIREAGTTKLFSVGAYQLTDEKTVDFESYTDLMDYVSINKEDNAQSQLNWTAPEQGNWIVFSFWEQPSCNKNNSADCYVIDHFGKAGAEACEDYWNHAIQEKEYLSYVTTIFNDSIEYQVEKEWTRGFLDIFRQQKGYDLTPYLPAIGKEGYYNTEEGPNFEFNVSGMADQINNDYEDVLNYCYNEYHLKPLQEMAENHGMDIRYQVAYNKPLSMETSALNVGIPETEYLLNPLNLDDSSAAAQNVGSFLSGRAMSSSVHMTDQHILSAEMTAEFGNAYGQTYEDFAWWAKRGWSGGINRQVMHGSSYSGVWDDGELHGLMGDHWPGWQAFSGAMSNDFNRNTSDELAKVTVDYISRFNYIMQKDSRMDLAFYRDLNSVDSNETAEQAGVLVNAKGFSFDYVSPGILNYETAVVSNGVLNEQEASYKALILYDQVELELADAERILELAQQGWPIIIVGQKPCKLKNYSDILNGYTDQDIVDKIDQLLSMDHTLYIKDYHDIVSGLEQLEIIPDASYEQPVDIIARHQFDQAGEYYYLYNYNQLGIDPENPLSSLYPFIDKELAFQEKDVTITLKGEGKPYLMNGWDGTITPISNYVQNNGSVTLNLHFDEDEAKMIALLTDEQAEANGIAVSGTYVTQSEIPTGYQDGKLVAKATQNGSYSFDLNNGETLSKTAIDVQQPFDISSWNLQINALRRGETDYFRDSVWELLDNIQLTELKPWKEINPELENVSGVGTYTATFYLDKGFQEGYGAYIELGEVEDSFKLTINGTELEPVNQINTIFDIGEYLIKDENTIQIEVSTTLMNQYKGYGGSNSNPLASYGLLGVNGKVTIIPYQIIPIETQTDKGILNSVITYAENAKASGEYDNAIESVQQSFDVALENAKAVAKNENASQEVIDQAWKTLLNEIHKLGFVAGDKTELASLIEAANEINAELDRYVEAGKAEFTTALEAAVAVYEDGDAMQAEVNEAADNLLSAMLNLRFKADKSILEDVLAEAGKVDANAYTAESYTALQAAVAEASDVYSNENASQEEVDAAVTNVQAAMDNLVAIDGTPAETPMENNNTAGSQTGQESTTPKANAAKTGDFAPIAGLATITLAGAALLFTRKKK